MSKRTWRVGDPPLEALDDTPFAEKIRTLRFGFAAPGGREEFHGPTIRERFDRQVAEAKAAGIDATPVGTRWV